MPTTKGLLLALLFAGAAIGVSGCGGPPRASVRGDVSFDGKPIETGTIEFYPADGKGQTAGTAIKDGKYEIPDASVGPMKVRVTSSVVVGKHKVYEGVADSPYAEDVRQIIPKEYNTETTLQVDLKAGPNEHNFDLKKDAKK
jgi:hypothetical protein